MAKQHLVFLLLAAFLALSSQAFLLPSINAKAVTRAHATRLQAVADAKSPEEFDKVCVSVCVCEVRSHLMKKRET